MNAASSYLAFPTLAFLAALLSGCGSGGSGLTGQSGKVITITTQPASQSVPLSSSATFSVTATEATPATFTSYQWSKDGAPIPGANTAAYITPAVTLADSGSTYTVIVSNSTDSVASTPAMLTVGPRSPKPGDLRFQNVDSAAAAAWGLAQAYGGSISYSLSAYASNAIGTPLQLGGDCTPGTLYDCNWAFVESSLPSGQTGLSVSYYGGVFSSFSSDLAGSNPRPGRLGSGFWLTNAVITSLDFEPVEDSYGIAWMSTSQNESFDMRREVVAPSAVASTVAQDAAQSRVVTAVSFDANGQANLFSYGWQGDTTTVYDTEMMNVAAQDVSSAASSMAGQGYIITAFGGSVANGYILIGTKVQGDTLPRSVLVQTLSNNILSSLQGAVGYAPVVWVYYYVPGDPTGTADGEYEIYEQ